MGIYQQDINNDCCRVSYHSIMQIWHFALNEHEQIITVFIPDFKGADKRNKYPDSSVQQYFALQH